MKCPFCQHEDTKVMDKRDTEDLTRRRRECLKCEKRFTTYESPAVQLTVIKKNGSREQFSREKLLTGVMKACEKRPVDRETMETMVNKIESDLLSYGEEVDSRKIGGLVMKKLRKLDPVAYIRFASVYRSFDDISEFEKELRSLKKN